MDRSYRNAPIFYLSCPLRAFAGVFYGYKDFSVFFQRRDVDQRIWMTEFYGVVDQIIENLLDLSNIGIDVQ